MSLEMKYFVLKPAGCSHHANASRVAMLAYADAMRSVDSNLADAIKDWVEREQRIDADSREELIEFASHINDVMDEVGG